jgi:hypothetical protein
VPGGRGRRSRTPLARRGKQRAQREQGRLQIPAVGVLGVRRRQHGPQTEEETRVLRAHDLVVDLMQTPGGLKAGGEVGQRLLVEGAHGGVEDGEVVPLVTGVEATHRLSSIMILG